MIDYKKNTDLNLGIGIREASGHCAVIGLGLGKAALNMAGMEMVKSVIVLERDVTIIEKFNRSELFTNISGEIKNKINIQNTDASDWIPERTIDFLYMDKTGSIPASNIIEQVKKIQYSVLSENVYICGQEQIIYKAMEKEGRLDLLSDSAAIKEFAYGMFGLPLVVPENVDYGDIIRSVMDNLNMHYSTS